MMGSTLEERLKNPAIPTIRAEYMPLSTYLVRFMLSKSTGEDGLWHLWGTCGDSGFGTRWLKYQFGPRTIKRLQSRLVEKIKAVRF